MIEMIVDSVRMGTLNTQRVLILKERGGQRKLSIVLGVAEADPIITGLKKKSESRTANPDNPAKEKTADLPLAHDLISKIIETYHGGIKTIVINAIGRERYYATLTIIAGEAETSFDCRTPDAVALAVRSGAPIYIEETALEAGATHIKTKEPAEKVTVSTDDIKCPECGGKTTIRAATKGPNAGKKFHLCNNYPECRGKVSIQYKGH